MQKPHAEAESTKNVHLNGMSTKHIYNMKKSHDISKKPRKMGGVDLEIPFICKYRNQRKLFCIKPRNPLLSQGNLTNAVLYSAVMPIIISSYRSFCVLLPYLLS